MYYYEESQGLSVSSLFFIFLFAVCLIITHTNHQLPKQTWIRSANAEDVANSTTTTVEYKRQGIDAIASDYNSELESSGKLDAVKHSITAFENEPKKVVLYSYTTSSDLKVPATKNLTADDINYIIREWSNTSVGYTPFLGQGEAFIKASQITGLNPLYILAHAAWESNWGKSYLGQTRGNYFGINAVDSDPGAAYTMGGSVYSGIIAGAEWINSHYYEDGDTSLAMMNKTYASDQKWASGIVTIMNKSLYMLNGREAHKNIFIVK